MASLKTISVTLLRQKAEKQLTKQTVLPDLNVSEIDILKLNHELQVHQIELEMQNIELLEQLEEKGKRAQELVQANIELVFQKEEKIKMVEELIMKTKKLENLNSYFVDRELRMVELKKEINELLVKAGFEKKFPNM